jgi:hypothetical protein
MNATARALTGAPNMSKNKEQLQVWNKTTEKDVDWTIKQHRARVNI